TAFPPAVRPDRSTLPSLFSDLYSFSVYLPQSDLPPGNPSIDALTFQSNYPVSLSRSPTQSRSQFQSWLKRISSYWLSTRSTQASCFPISTCFSSSLSHNNAVLQCHYPLRL